MKICREMGLGPKVGVISPWLLKDAEFARFNWKFGKTMSLQSRCTIGVDYGQEGVSLVSTEGMMVG
jgi:hypothetical protein